MTDKELYQQMLHFIECSGYRAESIKKELKIRLSQPEPEELGEIIPADEEQLKRIARLVKLEKQWVGLTDEEISKIYDDCDDWEHYEYERAIEAKLKEKNSG